MSFCFFFFSSRRRHTRWTGDWSSDVCSSDLDRRLVRHQKFSGGYYIACGGKFLMANETTITGSIGVIIQTLNRSEERRVGKECRYRRLVCVVRRKVVLVVLRSEAEQAFVGN